MHFAHRSNRPAGDQFDGAPVVVSGVHLCADLGGQVLLRGQLGDHPGLVDRMRERLFAITVLVHFQGPPIRRGVEANTLQIIAKGPQIAVVVNGEPLAHARDESFSGGTIILVVCNGGDTPLEVRFDNFEVWDISDLSK